MKNKYINFSFIIFIFLISLTAIFTFQTNNSTLAEQNQNINIPNISVNDDYFCLKDYYHIETPNQDGFGTCWIFSWVKSYETLLLKTTGEHYDFSEAWLTLCNKVENPSFTIGRGGYQDSCHNLATKYGLLLESEFPYDNLYGIASNNYLEIYNMYKDKTHSYGIYKYNMSNVASNYATKEEKISFVKSYLLENCAIPTNINDSEFIYLNSNVFSYSEKVLTHAVSIIGWDDNASFTDNNRIKHTGTFIALNSWGTDSNILHISYDDPNVLNYLYAFNENIILDESIDKNDIIITNSNASFDNYSFPCAQIDNYNKSQTKFLDKNIFSYGDLIDIEYKYSNIENYNNVNIELVITKNNINQNKNFQITYKLNNFIDLKTNGIVDSGTYILTFNIDFDNDGVVDNEIQHIINIYSNVEFSYILTARNTKYETYQMFNTVLSTKEKNTIYAFSNASSTIRFAPSEYALIKNVFCDNNDAFEFKDFSEYQSYSPYTTTLLTFTLPSYCNEFKLYTFNMYFQTYDNVYIQIEIKWYLLSNNDNKIIVYNSPANNFETNTQKYFAFGENYTDINFQTKSKDFTHNYYYYNDTAHKNLFSNSSITNSLLDNYHDLAHKNLYSDFNCKYAIVYLEVTNNLMFTYTSQNLGSNYHYGEQINIAIPTPINDIPTKTSLFIKNENWPQGVYCDPYTFSIVGTPMSTGDFYFDIEYEINGEKQTVRFDFRIQKRYITYTIDSKKSEYGETLLPLTYQIKKGSIASGDDIGIELSCDANSHSLGKYLINSTVNNTNYVAKYEYIFEPAYYTVVKRNIKYELTNYVGIYDGNSHTFDLKILNCNDCKIEYSLDKETYTTEIPTYKNITNLPIYIKISEENSNTLNIESSITITPRELTLSNIVNKKTYNQQFQSPDVTVENIISGDDAKILVSKGFVNSGIYNIDIISQNPNYILNKTIQFEIAKAIPRHQTKLVFEYDNNIKSLNEITLPNGYTFNSLDEKYEPNKVYYATFTPSDTQNYEIAQNIEVIFIKKNNNSALMITIITFALLIPISYVSLIIIKKQKKHKS